MEHLFEHSARLMSRIRTSIYRQVQDSIHWDDRLIGILGARGTGKSTLLVQQMRKLNLPRNEAVYMSLDDLFFAGNSLFQTIETFIQQGGKYLFLDEVHKYPEWSRHIKNVYDMYPELHMVFTGSSILDLRRQDADLSRRAVMYRMQGFSFREYLLLKHKLELPAVSLQALFEDAGAVYSMLPGDFRPFMYFEDYLKAGYYPFFTEGEASYHRKLQQVIRLVLESDLAELPGFDVRNARKMLQLLYILASNVPFKPNVSKLSSQTGIARNIVNNYLQHLQEAGLLTLMHYEGNSTAMLAKPEKVLLENPNLSYAIVPDSVNLGSLRETFFVNQVKMFGDLALSKQGDFILNGKYTLEVGGKNKSNVQISNTPHAFRVLDKVVVPYGNVIPLWMFGFLY
jgi:predicted AAA+ superfamily ATPase